MLIFMHIYFAGSRQSRNKQKLTKK